MKTPITIFFSLFLFLNLSAQSLRKTFYDPWAGTKIKEEYYVNSKNQKNGTYIKYDDRGLKAVKIHFTNGKPNGTAYEYVLPLIGYPGDEKVKKIANYVNGDQQGKTSYYVYIKDGKQNIKEGTKILQGEEYYEHDKKVREIAYFITGKKQMDAYLYNGYQKKWYENNVLAIEFYVKEGVYNGSWKEWYDKGQIGVDGVRKDGKWFGEKKEWYANGKIKSINHFTEGDYYGEIYKGEQNYYDSLGAIEKKVIYNSISNGKQNVKTTLYYPNGKPNKEYSEVLSNRTAGGSKHQYKDVIFYYENGNKSLEGGFDQRGNKDGLWVSYNEDGTKNNDLKYSNGYRVGKWTIYYNQNWEEVELKSEASFYREITFTQNGSISNDPVRDYYSNGQLQFEGKMTSLDPEILDGSCVYYYPNGNKMSEGMMTNGQKSGQWKDYHENGNLKLTSNYAINPMAGPTFSDPLSKNKVYEMNGIWFYYNEDGIKYKKERYSYGKLTSTKDIKIKTKK